MISSRRALFLIQKNPLCWRQFSCRPEGSPSNWTDDIRPGAGDGIPSDQNIRRVNQHPGGKEGGDGVEMAKERTEEAADTLADLAKEGAVKTIDAGLELGGIAKRTMDIAWDAAKDTANNLRDAVTGDDHRKRGVR